MKFTYYKVHYLEMLSTAISITFILGKHYFQVLELCHFTHPKETSRSPLPAPLCPCAEIGFYGFAWLGFLLQWNQTIASFCVRLCSRFITQDCMCFTSLYCTVSDGHVQNHSTTHTRYYQVITHRGGMGTVLCPGKQSHQAPPFNKDKRKHTSWALCFLNQSSLALLP